MIMDEIKTVWHLRVFSYDTYGYDSFGGHEREELVFADEIWTSKRKAAVRANHVLRELFKQQVRVRDIMQAEHLASGARFGDPERIISIRERVLRG